MTIRPRRRTDGEWMIWDFIKSLGRQRVQSVEIQAKGKLYSAKARARGKVAGAFNKGVDGALNKAKGKVTGGGKGSASKPKAKPAKGKNKMGWFGKDKNQDASEVQEVSETDLEYGDKTQYIQMVDERPRECVGWVVVLNGPQKGQDFRLVGGKNLVGTAADCDIVLTDQFMSSRHAVIRHEDGNFMLVDLDSTNGTFVNDDRVSKEELIDNDRVRFGKTELKFKSLY